MLPKYIIQKIVGEIDLTTFLSDPIFFIWMMTTETFRERDGEGKKTETRINRNSLIWKRFLIRARKSIVRRESRGDNFVLSLGNICQQYYMMESNIIPSRIFESLPEWQVDENKPDLSKGVAQWAIIRDFFNLLLPTQGDLIVYCDYKCLRRQDGVENGRIYKKIVDFILKHVPKGERTNAYRKVFSAIDSREESLLVSLGYPTRFDMWRKINPFLSDEKITSWFFTGMLDKL